MRRFLSVGMVLSLATVGWGFSYVVNSDNGLPIKWAAGTVSIKVMADNSTLLSDGSTRATSVQAAMSDPLRGWNHFIGNVQLSPQIAAVGEGVDHNASNEIFFSTTVFGESWDSNVLAITTGWSSGNRRTEADIIFNSNLTWDSYRGVLRATSSSGPYDIRRVALHELGHLLGLDHPDQAGQSVAAIMNSNISNLDSLQADDISGAQSLYGAPGGAPGNDNFANAAPITLVGNTAQVNAITVAATKESGEPNHAGIAGGHSVWWKWSASNSGALTVNTAGSNFNTTLAIYTGPSVSSLTAVASNDDVQSGSVLTSSLTFNTTSGSTYYFAVDGKGSDLGSVVLNLSFIQQIPRPAGFNALGYLARNPDVAAAFGNDLDAAWQHYLNYGINEGRVFDDSFRVDEYLGLYGDLRAAFGTDRRAAVLHWLTYGRAEGRMGRVPVTFDVARYLANNPDLLAAFGGLPEGQRKAAAWNHYLNYGVNEGRSDGDFDVRAYLAQYGDLQAAFGNNLEAAALHWYVYGRYEGRRIPAGFDVQGYFARNPDVQAAVGLDLYGGWLHYWNYGLNEGRVYDELFRVDQYLALYADLRAAFGTDRQAALLHWLHYGRAEGRKGRF